MIGTATDSPRNFGAFALNLPRCFGLNSAGDEEQDCWVVLGTARQGTVRQGMVWSGKAGAAVQRVGRRAALPGAFRRIKGSWHGLARFGLARRGSAWSGMAGAVECSRRRIFGCVTSCTYARPK